MTMLILCVRIVAAPGHLVASGHMVGDPERMLGAWRDLLLPSDAAPPEPIPHMPIACKLYPSEVIIIRPPEFDTYWARAMRRQEKVNESHARRSWQSFGLLAERCSIVFADFDRCPALVGPDGPMQMVAEQPRAS